MNKELWDKCVAFHGHSCPGLAISFRAATLALELLGGEESARDEELVCVTENDACGETVPEHKVRLVDGKPYCLDYFAPYDRGW